MKNSKPVAFLLVGTLLAGASSVSAQKPRKVEQEKPKEVMLDRVAAERDRNERAYRREYLTVAETLRKTHPGKWLAIVSGKLLPKNDGKPAPTKSLEALDRELRKLYPKARHRFCIRIGDEGDRTWGLGMTQRRFTIGRRFLKGIATSFIHAAAGGFWIVDGKKKIPVPSGDPKFDIMPTVLAPHGSKERKRKPCGMLFTNLCEGTALLGAEFVEGFQPELWELPGSVSVRGFTRLGKLRRVWLRFRFAGTRFDFVQHVGLWPAPSNLELKDDLKKQLGTQKKK